jgi:hypothetical protein
MSYAVTHADLSRCLYIDGTRTLRFQDMTRTSFAVIGSNSRTGILLDPFTSEPSTMPYQPNDYAPRPTTPTYSHNGPGEAEEYDRMGKPSLWLKLQAALGFGFVLLLVGGSLLLGSCKALIPHGKPAKRTAFADPEQPAPDSTYFTNL